MSFEADLKGHLQASLASLVADRIYPMFRAPGSTLPALAYQIISDQPQNCLDGFTSGITKYRVQVDCWSTTHAGLVALKAAVKTRMNTTAATFTSILEFGQDVYEEETKLYRSILDFSCGFKE